VALPPGNADLISIQSLARDFASGDTDLLYPGPGFAWNDVWVSHHEANLRALGAKGEPNWCFYPPLIPYLLSPVASVDPEIWRLVWGAVQIGLLALYALIIERLLVVTGAARAPSKILILALVLGSYPVARSVELGQTSLLLSVLLWAGVLFGLQSRRILQSLAVGISVFVKPFLALALVPDVARRKWSSALGPVAIFAMMTVLSLALIGLTVHVDYVRFLNTLASSQTAYAGNQSLIGGLLRLFTDLPVTDYGFTQNPLWAWIGRGMAVVVLLTAARVQWSGRDVSALASVGLWLSAVLLALPVSWEHHLLFLLPALAFLWAESHGKSERFLLGSMTVFLAFNWSSSFADHGLGRLTACLPLLGNLMLFVTIARVKMGQQRLATGDLPAE